MSEELRRSYILETKRHYVALVTDPTLNNEVLVFSLRARDPKQARRAVQQWYEDQGWLQENIKIRLISLRDKDVQYIGHATADKDVEAIRTLCEEVLSVAEGEPITAYADKLRSLVQSFDIGRKVFTDRYAETNGPEN